MGLVRNFYEIFLLNSNKYFPQAQYGCAPGVVRTRVGFTGGTKVAPTYRSLGDHTETVELEYDVDRTSYRLLLL